MKAISSLSFWNNYKRILLVLNCFVQNIRIGDFFSWNFEKTRMIEGLLTKSNTLVITFNPCALHTKKID